MHLKITSLSLLPALSSWQWLSRNRSVVRYSSWTSWKEKVPLPRWKMKHLKFHSTAVGQGKVEGLFGLGQENRTLNLSLNWEMFSIHWLCPYYHLSAWPHSWSLLSLFLNMSFTLIFSKCLPAFLIFILIFLYST